MADASALSNRTMSEGPQPPPLKVYKTFIVRLGVVIIVVQVLVVVALLFVYLKPMSHKRAVKQTTKSPDSLRHRIKADEEPHPVMKQLYDAANGTNAERPCETTGCRWLKGYLGGRGRGQGPCDDFYGHVCGGRRRSIYQDGVDWLMAAIKRGLASSHVDNKPGRPHAVFLDSCLEGRDVVSKQSFSSVPEEHMVTGCPARFPQAPERVSDDFFRRHRNATIGDFNHFINNYRRLALGRKMNDETSRGAPWRPFPSDWIPTASLWVARSARCYSEQTLMRPPEKTSERLWQLLYFAPFMGRQGDPLVTLAYAGSPEPRLRACLQLLEDVFPAETVAEATRTLGSAVGDAVALLGHQALQVLQWWVAALVDKKGDDPSPHGTSLEHSVKRMTGVRVTIVNGSREDPVDMSIFSWQVRFLGHANSLVLPLGLLGALANASSSAMDTVFVPPVGAAMLRALQPRPDEPNFWPRSYQDRLRAVARCLSSRLGVDESRAMRVVSESALLVPLRDLYLGKLWEEFEAGVRLHSDYSNEGLFFVLWALGHCGTPHGAEVVNEAAKNSALFERAFRCGARKAMTLRKRCSFWG